jgi:transcriptional regulator with XRE-family HTH domain
MDIEHRINLMHCTTSRIEQGFRNPSLNVLERLADCLQIPITWLMQPVTNERIAELFAREVLLATRQVGVQLDAVRKLIALRERRAG